MRRRMGELLISVGMGIGLVLPAIAEDSSFAIWLTAPNTQTLLGVLLLVCACGFPALILVNRKLVKPTGEPVEKLLDAGNIEQAINLYGQKIRSSSQLSQKLALAFVKSERTDNDAIQLYEKVNKDNLATEPIIQQLARCYALQAKDDIGALAVYEKAITAGMNDPAVLQITGDSLVKKREWAKADRKSVV